MEIPITQSKAWAKLQDDLGEKSFFEQGSNYSYLAIKNTTKLGNYLYLPYGPIIDDKNSYKNAINSLQKLAKRENAFFVRIEPQNTTIIKHFPKNFYKSKDLNPKETWILDLKGTDDDLKSRLPSRLLRYYKAAAKNGITVEPSNDPNDIKYLINFQNSLARQKKINTFSEHYLKTELMQPFSTLYLVKHQDSDGKSNVVAAGLIFDHQKTRYNIQGAQSEQGKKLHATGILTIQLILDAKKQKLTTFDFWGIAPEGAPKNHPWAGFTNFKKTFKGEQKNYAGTYDIVFNPTKYKIYQITRAINRLIRKIK